jgi:hypothetical protein
MGIIPVYPEIHIKDIDKYCGQIAKLFYVETGSAYNQS